MVAAFGSGAMFSLVSGMGGPNQAANAVTSGLFFALVQGGLFQVGVKEKQMCPFFIFYFFFVRAKQIYLSAGFFRPLLFCTSLVGTIIVGLSMLAT